MVAPPARTGVGVLGSEPPTALTPGPDPQECQSLAISRQMYEDGRKMVSVREKEIKGLQDQAAHRTGGSSKPRPESHPEGRG